MNQLEIHEKINKFFKAGVKAADVDVGKKLASEKNFDAKKYFFNKVDEDWLSWLWDNGFLDKIKGKADDPTRYSYNLPELDYLMYAAKEDPAGVAKIINEIKISEENFNPEVIDRFLWIIRELPIKQIKKLVSKIKEDGWVYLMKDFNKSAHEFNKIIKKLVEAKEFEALLEIVEAMLEVRAKENNEQENIYSNNDSFYLHDINEIGLFEVLADMDGEYAKEVLELTSEVLSKIIKQRGKGKNDVFKYEDIYALYDKDIFTVEFDDIKTLSMREDFENLVVAIKKLIEKTIGKCSDKKEVKELFGIIDKISENHLAWRIKLFALSQCPEIFKKEIKDAFFRVFSKEVGKRYFDITGGAEYHQLLVHCFNVLDPKTEQREYAKKVFEYFGAKLKDKDREKYRKRDGGQILCFIKNYLTPEEKKEIKKKFDIAPDKAECAPEPISSGIRSGMVTDRSPEDINKLSIVQIIQKLKTELTPEQLKEKYKNDDFLNPRSIEALGSALKEDIKKRIDDYLDKICEFFDRKNIDSHYLYSILRGIEEMLRNKTSFNDGQVEQIIKLFDLIKESGKEEEFKREKENESWLADWITVHRAMADIALLFLENNQKRERMWAKSRKEILNIIKYLLSVTDSSMTDDKSNKESDPFNVAINSVRGRAYQAFVMFVQNERKGLNNDIKKIFEQVIGDESLAARFVIGHYLATFYFRDKEFIVRLLPKIFPKDDLDKKDIYLATWEGYLTNTLYSKLFDELEDYYEYAILLKPKEYTDRKYHKNLDGALAIHLALAFAHLNLEQGDFLFEQFWNEPNIKRHKEFISFIGRSCLIGNKTNDGGIEKNNAKKKKLLKFWDWVLDDNISNPEALAGFGFWVKHDKETWEDEVVVKRMAKTIKKLKGKIDWDYGFLRRLPSFAEKNGEKTYEIIRNYLLDSNNRLYQNRRAPVLHREDIKKALKIIYNNGNKNLKQKVTDLINILIEKGSSDFWGLKGIL